jgi:AcrR family transcriptional regulator
VSENAIIIADGAAARIAAKALAKRTVDTDGELRRLLDAALAVMASQGTSARARVADIVATAGLSNDAFYRYFPSKDALVAALLEDGTDRLARWLARRMAGEPTAEAQIRVWVEGVLAQTDERLAATALAVLWNGSPVGTGLNTGRHNASPPLAELLHEPFRALGSTALDLDTTLAAHAVLGKVADHLWAGTRPSGEEIDLITEFCIRVAQRR